MIEIPIRIESTPNKREHFHARARRTKKQRDAVGWLLKTATRLAELPAVVKLTRISPRMMDDDNAIAGMKAVRDAVAEWLGVDDGDKRIAWRYAQAKGRPHQHTVQIEFLTA